MQTNPALQAKLEALRAQVRENDGKPITSVAEVPIEDIVAIPNSETLLKQIITYDKPKPIFRQEGASLIPCMATLEEFVAVSFKSRVREHLGEEVAGVSCDIYGFDCKVVPGTGEPMTEPVLDPITGEPMFDPATNEPLTTFIMITKDEEGNDLEPRYLMTFRLQYGVDRTKQSWARLKGEDMITLSANRGVPRKKRDVTNVPATTAEDTTGEVTEDYTKPPEQTTTNYGSDQIAWELIPRLQDNIIKPLLNAKQLGLQNLILIEELIPVSSTAPSRKLAQQAGFQQAVPGAQGTVPPQVPPTVQNVTAGMNPDVFAAPPTKDDAKKEDKPKK